MLLPEQIPMIGNHDDTLGRVPLVSIRERDETEYVENLFYIGADESFDGRPVDRWNLCRIEISRLVRISN